MSEKIKYISRIKDEFDTVICGVNGVITQGDEIKTSAVATLIKMYQAGKKIVLASNSGMRANDLFCFLKRGGVPMNIFQGLITAGEIAHFYLKNNHSLGQTYYALTPKVSCVMQELDYRAEANMVTADFVVAETTGAGVDVEDCMQRLEQALLLKLPLVCVGNNTMIATANGVHPSVGTLAEQYALQGGKIIPFGKPDVRIAAYLTEGLAGFAKDRCLVIGDGMATDMRMAAAFKAKSLLLTGGVHQLGADVSMHQIDELSAAYGLNVDYFAEELQW